MRRSIQGLWGVLAFALITLNAAWPVEPGARAQSASAVLVVIGKSAKITDISLALLRRAFTGQAAEYGNGKRLVPLNHPQGSAVRTLFDRVVLNLEPADVGRFWINRRIRDEGLPPRTLPSSDMAVRAVASVAGAITYVSAGVSTSQVQVLTIDGKSVKDAGYPLAGR